MATRSILLLDAATSYAWGVVRCLATDRNIRLHALSRSARVPLRASRLTASFRVWRGVLGADALDEVRRHVDRVRPDVVMAADEAPIAFLSAHGDELGARTMLVAPLEKLAIAKDKWALARFLAEHGLTHPPTTVCGSDEESVRRIRGLRFPVLIKPRHGGYGAGIRRFETADELVRELGPRAHELVAQSFIEGDDIDCSVLCRNGRILAHTIQRPFTPVRGYRPAGGVEFIHDDRVLSVVSAVVTALRWNGVAHLDLRYDTARRTLNVIEINPRFWGSVLGSLHAGVNFPLLAVHAALDEPFATPEFRSCRYVSGNTAAEIWSRGRLGQGLAGFRLADTVFKYALFDPLPWLVERFCAPIPRLSMPFQMQMPTLGKGILTEAPNRTFQ